MNAAYISVLIYLNNNNMSIITYVYIDANGKPSGQVNTTHLKKEA